MNYTFNQQVFCLNTLSNRSSAYNGMFTNADDIASHTKNDIIQALADGNIQNEIGVWNLLWGPRVAAHDGKAINTMYIASNAEGQYVVAIAGTDMTSIKDWCSEDFNVATKVEWPLYTPTKQPTMTPMISNATSDGLKILLGMTDPANNSQSALDFLKKQKDIKSITVTGHSLGGALSPAYALYSYQSFASARGIQVYCNPVAGPTPGDIVFAGYYDNQLGTNTTRVWNSQDVVPHAWNAALMKDIEALYFPEPACPPDVIKFVETLRNDYEHNNYTHVVADAPSFTSGLYKSGSSGIDAFLAELKCQHICAYGDYFEIGAFQQRLQTLFKLTAPYFSAGCVVVLK